MKQILFNGAATALVTPMRPDASVDLQTLAKLTEYLRNVFYKKSESR